MRVIEDIIRDVLGRQLIEIAALQAEIEKLRARIAELEKKEAA